jgi:hypothetical protein
MNKKLTLNIEKELIKAAKKYARQRDQSLSALVHKFFAILEEDINDTADITPAVKDLTGIVKLPEDYDHKKEYKDYIIKKYS